MDGPCRSGPSTRRCAPGCARNQKAWLASLRIDEYKGAFTSDRFGWFAAHMAHEGRLLRHLPREKPPGLARREDPSQFFLHGNRDRLGFGLQFFAFVLVFRTLVAHNLAHLRDQRVSLL